MSDDRTYPARPIVGVGAVVWRGARVLLIQRGKNPGKGGWSLPGGAQELGETIEQTARREVFEEAGVEVGELSLLGAFDSIEPHNYGGLKYHFTLIDFEAEWLSGEPAPGEAETDARFFELAEIEALNLWHPIHDVIAASRKRRKQQT